MIGVNFVMTTKIVVYYLYNLRIRIDQFILNILMTMPCIYLPLELELFLALSLLGDCTWPRREDEELFLGSLTLLFTDSIFSSASTTSFMDGLLFGSPFRHLRVSWAARRAPLGLYCPSSPLSISWLSFLRSDNNGLAQFTKFTFSLWRLGSNALRPEIISSSTTPKPYTSLFTYRWPSSWKMWSVNI